MTNKPRRVILKLATRFVFKKQARSTQFQLALRRINGRRASELSSANWSLPENQTNRSFAMRSHVMAVARIETEVTLPAGEMELNND